MSSRTLQKKCSRFALKYTCLYARVLCVYMYIYKCVPVYRERWLRLKCDEIIESLYCHTPYLASGVSFIRYIILDTVTNALYLIIPRIDPAMNSSYRSSTAFRIFYQLAEPLRYIQNYDWKRFRVKDLPILYRSYDISTKTKEKEIVGGVLGRVLFIPTELLSNRIV